MPILRRLLRIFGLATLGELGACEEKLHGVRQRLEKTAARMDEAIAASERFQKAHRDDAHRHKAALAEREAEYARRTADAKEALARASRRIAVLEEDVRTRDAQLEADVRQQASLEEQVAAAARDLAEARGSLAAIEVKLDILQGAANVLDARVRRGAGV